MAETIRQRFGHWITGNGKSELAQISVRVDDSSGWTRLAPQTHDYDAGTVQEHYSDSLEAWRKNPIAWRIVAITTDYVVGDRVTISSPKRDLQRFITNFWHHSQNRMELRLAAMSDELSRAGDLFVTLHRNPLDGMSYVRFVTKDRIERIETSENDWEHEIAYYETQETGEARKWISATSELASSVDAVMLHYSVNRPLGALMGEGDITSMLPWLQRYSRMLEDRVRLNWALRSFLWVVTVPSTKIREKQEQYRTPPDTGSIIVKDESETWEAVTPNMQASDAQHDLKAVRGMIDAGSGYPPHWRGEAADANLATDTAMQGPTERHLLRRQKYFNFMLQDILYHSYQRAVEAGKARRINIDDYEDVFIVQAPDISRSDNESLARATKDLAAAFTELQAQLSGSSSTLQKLMLKIVMRFAGEPQAEELLAKILQEAKENPRPKPEPKEREEKDDGPDSER